MHTFFKLILTVLLGSVIIAQEFDPETGEMINSIQHTIWWWHS